MWNENVWGMAKSIPSMSTCELLRFYYSGFSLEVNKLAELKIDASLLKSYDPNSDPKNYITAEDLQVKLSIINNGMVNPDFRNALTSNQLRSISRLVNLASGKYRVLSSDFKDLMGIPLSSFSDCMGYLKLTGLHCELSAIRSAISAYLSESDNYMFYNEALGIHQVLSKSSVLSESRMRLLYDCYTYVRKLILDSSVDSGVRFIFSEDSNGEYTKVWSYLVGKYGLSDDLYPVYHVKPDYWWSGRKISEFKDHFSPNAGDISDYFCGSDNQYGFYSDISILSKAIDACYAGKEYFLCSIFDIDMGGVVKTRVSVRDVLSEDRIAHLRGYIEEGMKLKSLLETGTKVEGVSLNNLGYYNFDNPETVEYRVYQFILNNKVYS